MKTLIFATGNAHKAYEVRKMLEGLDVEVLTLKEAGLDLDIVEDGETFRENSLIKARAVFAASGKAVLADDSGIEIDAFDGGPGVHSSRFMGEDTPYPVKCAAILERMKDVPEEKRGADFRCVMSFIAPDAEGKPRETVEEGAVYGRIAYAPAGQNGFGYDPIFYLPERGVTTAELSDEEKNAISHRGRALQAMKPHLVRWIEENTTDTQTDKAPASYHERSHSTMKRYEISLPSSDGKTTLHGYRWDPEGDVRAVVQLVHGMEEYIGRYDDFASWLASQGIAVIGHDHLGHGGSVTDESELGYFAKEKGYECVLRDMHAVTLLAKKEYPDRPVFMLAHSMGSFFGRRYITVYPRELAGIILSGTGSQPYIAVHVGKQLSRLIAKFKGDHYRSRMVENLAVGGYGGLENWLCTRDEIVEAYKADPLCGFPFTVWAYKDFFKTMEYLALGKDQDRIPKDFPVLLIAGMLDPVGNKSKGVLQVYNHYKKIGLTDADVFLYKDDMHEILNETDREDVYNDVLRWLDKRIDNLKTN